MALIARLWLQYWLGVEHVANGYVEKVFFLFITSSLSMSDRCLRTVITHGKTIS